MFLCARNPGLASLRPGLYAVAPFGGWGVGGGRVYPGLASLRPGLYAVAPFGGYDFFRWRVGRDSCQ